MIRKNLFSGVVLLFLSGTLFFSWFTGAQGYTYSGLSIGVASNNPVGAYVTGCEADLPVASFRITADIDDVRVTDLYLVNIDPQTKKVSSVTDALISSFRLQYGNKSVYARSAQGLIHFSFEETGNFLVPLGGNVQIQVFANAEKVRNETAGNIMRLALIPSAVAGGSLDPTNAGNFRSGTVSGVRAILIANGELIASSTVAGEGKDYVFTKSAPSIVPVPLSSDYLFEGSQQDLFRFSVTASPCGSIELGDISFDISASNATVRNLTLYDVREGNVPLNYYYPNSLGGTGGSSTTVTLHLDKNAPNSGIEVSEGTVNTFVLKGDITFPDTIKHSLSTRISQENSNYARGTYDSLTGNHRLLWSDLSGDPHVLNGGGSSDWINGRLLRNLPTTSQIINNESLVNDTVLESSAPTVTDDDASRERVPFTLFQLHATGSKPVTIYQLILQHSSSSQAGTLLSSWLEVNGSSITPHILSRGSDRFIYPFFTPLEIPANGYAYLKVYGSVEQVTGEHMFTLERKEDLFCSTTQVEGAFPLWGNVIPIAEVLPSQNTNTNWNGNINLNTNTNSSNTNVNSITTGNTNGTYDIQGPTLISVGQQNTWRLVGVENGILTRVYWGDGTATSVEAATVEYSYTYGETGIYQIDMTVLSGTAPVIHKLIRVGNTAITLPAARWSDAVLANVSAYGNPFSDVKGVTLVGRAALELYRRAVVSGYSDGSLQPDRFVNRVEALKMLLVTRDGFVPRTQNVLLPFLDTDGTSWYYKYLIRAYNEKVIQGYADNQFRPNNRVNTVEFLKMMTLVFGLEKNLSYNYPDVKSTDWFAPYAGMAQKYQLFPERTTNLLPGRELTRGEVVIALFQYLANR